MKHVKQTVSALENESKEGQEISNPPKPTVAPQVNSKPKRDRLNQTTINPAPAHHKTLAAQTSARDNQVEQCLNGIFANFNDTQRRELWAALALKHTQGLGKRSAATLMQAYGSAYAAICEPENWQNHGIFSSVIAEFQREEWRQAAGEEWANLKTPLTSRCPDKCSQQSILLWTNPYYPEHLKNTPVAPVFLYYQGDISLLSNPGVGVVGARAASSDGLAASNRISSELSKSGVTVISGLARGVDREAHLAALKGPGSTIAVLGCGLDVYYPKENVALQNLIAESGLLLSEYSAGTRPDSFHFPVRNRIISALSLGVLVVEAAARSGSLITARLALEYGREVFAIPGKYAASRAQGCHSLIRRGAKPVLDIEDVIEELLPKLQDFASFGKKVVLENPQEIPSQKQIKTTDPVAALAQKMGQKAQSGKKMEQASKNPKSSAKTITPANQPCPASLNALSELDQSIINLLELHGPLQVDSICALLQTSVAKISSELLCMELKGLVKRYSGMIYALQ